MKILSHFSKEQFNFFDQKQYVQDDVSDFKPHGLWLSDESDYGWKQWCEDQAFRVGALILETKFECDTSKWLVLDSMDKVVRLGREFPSKKVYSYGYIDWAEIAKRYSGILITPYQWSCRLDQSCHWYYSWDCASACVWDLETIKRLEIEQQITY